MLLECCYDIKRNTIVENKFGDLYYAVQRVGTKYEDLFTLIDMNTGWSVIEANKKVLLKSGYKTIGSNISYKFLNRNRDTKALPIMLGDLVKIAGKLCWVCTHNNKLIIIIAKTGYYIPMNNKNIPEVFTKDRFKLISKNFNFKVQYSLTS